MNREELIKALEELKASINKKYSTKYTTDNNLDRENGISSFDRVETLILEKNKIEQELVQLNEKLSNVKSNYVSENEKNESIMEWENKLEETKKNSQENRAIINGLKSSINKARNANQKDTIKIQNLENEIQDLTEEKSNPEASYSTAEIDEMLSASNNHLSFYQNNVQKRNNEIDSKQKQINGLENRDVAIQEEINKYEQELNNAKALHNNVTKIDFAQNKKDKERQKELVKNIANFDAMIQADGFNYDEAIDNIIASANNTTINDDELNRDLNELVAKLPDSVIAKDENDRQFELNHYRSITAQNNASITALKEKIANDDAYKPLPYEITSNENEVFDAKCELDNIEVSIAEERVKMNKAERENKYMNNLIVGYDLQIRKCEQEQKDCDRTKEYGSKKYYDLQAQIEHIRQFKSDVETKKTKLVDYLTIAPNIMDKKIIEKNKQQKVYNDLASSLNHRNTKPNEEKRLLDQQELSRLEEQSKINAMTLAELENTVGLSKQKVLNVMNNKSIDVEKQTAESVEIDKQTTQTIDHSSDLEKNILNALNNDPKLNGAKFSFDNNNENKVNKEENKIDDTAVMSAINEDDIKKEENSKSEDEPITTRIKVKRYIDKFKNLKLIEQMKTPNFKHKFKKAMKISVLVATIVGVVAGANSCSKNKAKEVIDWGDVPPTYEETIDTPEEDFDAEPQMPENLPIEVRPEPLPVNNVSNPVENNNRNEVNPPVENIVTPPVENVVTPDIKPEEVPPVIIEDVPAIDGIIEEPTITDAPDAEIENGDIFDNLEDVQEEVTPPEIIITDTPEIEQGDIPDAGMEEGNIFDNLGDFDNTVTPEVDNSNDGIIIRDETEEEKDYINITVNEGETFVDDGFIGDNANGQNNNAIEGHEDLKDIKENENLQGVKENEDKSIDYIFNDEPTPVEQMQAPSQAESYGLPEDVQKRQDLMDQFFQQENITMYDEETPSKTR